MKSLLFYLTISLYSVFAFGQDPCASISISGGGGQVTVSGLSGAPIAGIQVFNSSWASVFNQTYTSPANTINVPLAAGQYFVNVRLYNSSWGSICEKGGNVTVTESGPAPADTCTSTFQKNYGMKQGNDEAHNVTRTSDGGFIAIGQAAANGTTNHDGLLMKFDNKGNLLWSKTLGSAESDYLSRVVATTDGGALAVGSTRSAGHNSFSGNCWAVRVDGNGNVLWQKEYVLSGGPGNIIAVTKTSDGGFGIAGTVPFTPGAADQMVMKLDANGNIQWQKKLGTGDSDNGSGIIEDNHGGAGLVVAGNIGSSSYYDAALTKLDMATGDVLWTKAYDFDNRANWVGIAYQVSDGLVFDLVNASGYGSDNAKVGILKTDFSGNVIWAKEFIIPNCRDARMTPLADGTFMIVEGEMPHDASSDNYLMRISAAGEIMWAKRYTRPGAQFFWGLAADGDHVVGAGLETSGSYNDVLIGRVDLNGKMGTCPAVNVSATVRNCVVTPVLNFAWPVNTALNLTALNTTYAVTTQTPVATTWCAGCPATLSFGNVTVSENAGSATLQACLSTPTADTLLFSYRTQDGTAQNGSDYTGGEFTITFYPGETCKNISIPIINDANSEPTETFTVVSGPATGTITINDDDIPPYDCNAVTVTAGSNVITVTGVAAPIATVQVFNTNWAAVFNQTYTNSPGTVTVNIGPGTYIVKVTFYTSNWAYICDKSVNNVVVENNCPAGVICIANICPSVKVNLNDAYSIANLPAGAKVTWHTGTPATDANKMTDEEAQNVTVSGTYYAALNVGGCYSATIPVNVTINPCNIANSGTVNATQAAIEGRATAGNITAFPNPFTSSVRVVIDSEKRERATLTLMDVQGRQLKQMPVQLVPGSNSVLMEGLEKFTGGNYFLRLTSGNEVKTLKLTRQQ